MVVALVKEFKHGRKDFWFLICQGQAPGRIAVAKWGERRQPRGWSWTDRVGTRGRGAAGGIREAGQWVRTLKGSVEEGRQAKNVLVGGKDALLASDDNGDDGGCECLGTGAGAETAMMGVSRWPEERKARRRGWRKTHFPVMDTSSG